MPDRDREQKPKRRYPPLYEKVLPIAMTLIALAILVVLIVIFAVVFGLFPGS